MKIRIGLTKEDYQHVISKLQTLENAGIIVEKYNESKGVILAEIISNAIINLSEAELTNFITFLQQQNYALVDNDSIKLVKNKLSLDKLPSYQLAQAALIKENGFNYINFPAYTALNRKASNGSGTSEINLSIVQVRILLLKGNSTPAECVISTFSDISESAFCFKVIDTYNRDKLLRELPAAKQENYEVIPFAEQLHEILKQSPFYVRPQLIAVAYQLNQHNDYFYYRFGGILARERSWFALLLSGAVAAISLPCLIALLAINHGTATPALLMLGHLLLSVMQPHTLFVIAVTLASISLFSFMAELLVPAFNQTLVRNLYYFPVSLSQHLYQQGSHPVSKCLYATIGFIAGILYHPLFTAFFFITNLIANIPDHLNAMLTILLSPMIGIIKLVNYLNKVFRQPEVAAPDKMESQGLIETPGNPLPSPEENVQAVSPALQSVAIPAVGTDPEQSPAALLFEKQVYANPLAPIGSDKNSGTANIASNPQPAD